MPSFCRHNRLLQNCTICAREQHFEARPVVSSSAPKAAQPRERTGSPASKPRSARAPKPAAARGGAGAVRVRRLERGPDDGYRSALVPGLKSSADAERLAAEIAFAAHRLSLMERAAAGEPAAEAPPSWSEIAKRGDLAVRTEMACRYVLSGPRGLKNGTRLEETVAAFKAWSARSGSLARAFTGEPSWTPERRFERIFERLGGLPGLGRDARFELLTLLGRLGLYELRAGRLFLSGENEATWAAKRAFGIGDQLLLERRAATLAEACGAPLEALDLALHNWGSGVRLSDGLPPDGVDDGDALQRARAALGL